MTKCMMKGVYLNSLLMFRVGSDYTSACRIVDKVRLYVYMNECTAARMAPVCLICLTDTRVMSATHVAMVTLRFYS